MYKCKRCKSEEYVKAGFVKTEQRYKCKKCGCQFVPTRNKGRSKEEKLMAVWLYYHRLSFRAVAKLLKVSVRSVFVWVKQFAEDNYSKPILKKRQVWIWKAYCRTTKQLIDWECGTRDSETFTKLYRRLKKWNVKIYFTDRYRAYRDFISPECLIQTKSQTHLIESNNFS